MNIFILSPDPFTAARFHYDVHVRKMIVESAQMLSTCQRLKHGYTGDEFYNSTHIHHPCTKWVMESNENYMWLVMMSKTLCEIYTSQTGKIHKTQEVLEKLSHNVSCRFLVSGFPMITPFASAMPDDFKVFDETHLNYIKYYVEGKAHLVKSQRDRGIHSLLTQKLKELCNG